MSKLVQEFNQLEDDTLRLKWLLENQGKGLQLQLDNDAMLLVDLNDQDAPYGEFDSWLGTSEGVDHLLNAVGIEFDYC